MEAARKDGGAMWEVIKEVSKVEGSYKERGGPGRRRLYRRRRTGRRRPYRRKPALKAPLCPHHGDRPETTHSDP